MAVAAAIAESDLPVQTCPTAVPSVETAVYALTTAVAVSFESKGTTVGDVDVPPELAVDRLIRTRSLTPAAVETLVIVIFRIATVLVALPEIVQKSFETVTAGVNFTPTAKLRVLVSDRATCAPAH